MQGKCLAGKTQLQYRGQSTLRIDQSDERVQIDACCLLKYEIFGLEL